MFFRQLALLLESGTNIVTSLDMLRAQTSDRNLKRVLSEAVSDLRVGNQLSAALGKHPESFPPICCRSLSVGEQTGSLETVLRQMADYMEKEITATKEIKNALRYPVIVSIVAIIVIGVIVTFVLPAFTGLYSLLGIELPLMTRLLLSIVGWFTNYGLYLVAAVARSSAMKVAWAAVAKPPRKATAIKPRIARATKVSIKVTPTSLPFTLLVIL
ncbi:unnamed protein product [marine sediment metagenome]|uniref:Type II secretion system protein GspF domain-containing protein n=1 Tax=marine sediment metagenome TaxID=412755 RepID=X1TTU3_9ZZZZ